MKGSKSKKIAAITGAGRGNGKAIAIELGQRGFALFLSDIKTELLESTITDISNRGIEVSGGIFDSSDIKDADKFFQQIITNYGKLDVFVNNAGASRPQRFLDLTEEMWDWTIDLNLKGPFFLMQKAAKIMINQNSGSIINIASISSSGGDTSSPPYAIAKAGIVNMTVTAAVNLGKYGIRVNAVSPGIVNTHFHDEVDLLMGQKKLGLDNLEKLSIDDRKKIISDISKQKIENLKNEIPLGRIAESEDIADVVAFLSSDASRYISGETITVGGGKNQL